MDPSFGDGAAGSGAPRPRPQFGEYATPEEQAAHVRQPLPTPPVVPTSGPVPPASPVSPGGWPEAAEPRAARLAATPGRLLDRAVAVALLAYGLFSVISAAPETMDPRPLLEVMGLASDDVAITSTGGWGVAALVTLLAGWALTAWLTWRAHRRGMRSVFWIPFVGGFVFNMISGVLVSVALLSDPGVIDAVLRGSGG